MSTGSAQRRNRQAVAMVDERLCGRGVAAGAVGPGANTCIRLFVSAVVSANLRLHPPNAGQRALAFEWRCPQLAAGAHHEEQEYLDAPAP